jgi:hypothetical protein
VAKKPKTIGSEKFDSIEEAEEFYSKILNSYTDEQTITGNDYQLIFDLFMHHPRAAEKMGDGVQSFIRAKGKGGTSCFYVVQKTTGKKVDFSIKKAVKG